jgi:hypothetical protein
MRKLAHGLIVAGLLTALSGEVLAVLDHQAGLPGELILGSGRLVTVSVSIWSALGAGAVISGVGVGLLLLRSQIGRRRRRLISSRPGGQDHRA